MNAQTTLKSSVVLKGIGLHSGEAAQVTLHPANPDTGIVFIRADQPKAQPIIARFDSVQKTALQTVIGNRDTSIATVEHLLAALAGLEIDNAIVEVGGPEVPIMDGSSIPFVDAIRKAGILTQVRHRSLIVIRQRVDVKMAEKWAFVEPSNGFEISASVEWDHPSIGYQEFKYRAGTQSFSEIASARTFGFLRDVEALKRAGLARGGSLDNAVVLDEALVLNPGGLRYPNEFVRHKVLDAIGDLKLAGLQFRGHFRLHRAGHELHLKLLEQIFSNPENYDVVSTQPAAASVSMVSTGLLMPAALARVPAR